MNAATNSQPSAPEEKQAVFHLTEGSDDTQQMTAILTDPNYYQTQSGMEEFTSDWTESPPVLVQGNSLRTVSLASRAIERVQVKLKSHGRRSLNTIVELWQGPQNTPMMIGFYSENGIQRPFTAVLETPGVGYSIALRNTGHPDFAMDASIKAEVDRESGGENRSFDWSTPETSIMSRTLSSSTTPEYLQGGTVCSYPMKHNVESIRSVQILLQTDGRPLNARIELLDGTSDDAKQVMEVYSDNGLARPFFTIFETPGITSDTIVRVVNTSPGEYRMLAYVSPVYAG